VQRAGIERILGGWAAPTVKASFQDVQLSSRARYSTGACDISTVPMNRHQVLFPGFSARGGIRSVRPFQ
jgi:hypothetical protein